jgi:hypothetical protein
MLTVTLALSVVSAVSIFQGQGQNVLTPKHETATRVQEGVMTDQQKKHSKLYKRYKGIAKVRDLIRQDANSSGELTVTVLPGSPELSPEGQSKNAFSLLDNLAAKADAVIIGNVTDKESQLTEDGTFVFTDYAMKVEEVLMDNSKAHIELQRSLTVTGPGGKIVLNGRRVSVTDRSFKPMTTGGRYLFFLKYVADTGAYQAVSENGSFELIDNNAVLLTESPTESRNERNLESFLSDVRIAIALSQSDKRESK